MACSVYRTMKISTFATSMRSGLPSRTRNFRRAATEQGVSVSSLSQRLRDMEERLGVRLMNRTTRSVALHQAGELLLARVGSAMSDVGKRSIRYAACGGHAVERLRINAPPPAIDLRCWRRWSRRFLQRIQSIWRSSADAFVDIVAAGFDAGVRYGEHGAGHDRRLARSAAALRRGGLARICRAAWQTKHPKDARSRLHPHPLRQRRDARLGIREQAAS